MKNSAISILSTLSIQEINSFEEFLNSPFHNKNKKVIQLFEILKKYRPNFEDEALTKEKLYKELYRNEFFKESYVRNLFSDLKILLENFLLHSNISKSRSKNKILIEELNERDLTDLLNKKIVSFEKELGRISLKDQEYFLNRLFIYDVKSFSTIENTLTDDFRKDQIISIINFFLICLMESSFHLVIEEQRVQIKHDFSFLKYILNYVKNNLRDFADVPLIMIFYYLWMGILEDGDETNFTIARKHFKMHFDTLTQPDKKNIYSIMQVYYANKIQAGDFSYNRKLLDLLLEMLEYNVISHNKKNSINLNLYRNILILCFKLNEVTKLKKFVSEYVKFVRAGSRNTVSAYSSAHLNFMEGNFEHALVLCQKVNFNDLMVSTNENLYFKIDIRTLMMKSLYELKSFENLFSHIETFRQFLNNSKLMKESSRKKHADSLNAVRGMINLKMDFEGFRLMQLRKKVTTEIEIPGRDWILGKLDEIEKENERGKIQR